MSLARDLLEQAGHLATRESKRPKQASLRRAVSSAYYALFHLLIRDSAFDATPSSPLGLRELAARALGHADMKNVCKGFVAGNAAYLKSVAPGATKPFQTSEIPPSTQKVLVFPIEVGLIMVMSAFVDLQEARHDADYNTASSWNRMDVLTKVQSARDAFSAWASVKATPNAAVLKAALLLQKNWGR